MTYKWDTRLLNKYRYHPQISQELAGLFEDIDTNDRNPARLNRPTVISSDLAYYHDHPFGQEIFSEAVLATNASFPSVTATTVVSVNDAFAMTNAFYSSLPDDELKCAFRQMFDRRKGRLQSQRPKRNQHYAAITYTTPTGCDYFMDFLATRDIEMLNFIIHEFGHVTGFRYRNYQKTTYGGDFFCEVESLFMEMASQDFFDQKPEFKQDILSLRNSFYETLMIGAAEQLEKMDFAQEVMKLFNGEYGDDTDYTLDEMYDIASENTGIPVKQIKKNLRYPADDNFQYVYSGLVAIELYLIYRQDPASALDIYKRIISLPDAKPVTLHEEIGKLGIHAGEHIEDYVRVLKKQNKK